MGFKVIYLLYSVTQGVVVLSPLPGLLLLRLLGGRSFQAAQSINYINN